MVVGEAYKTANRLAEVAGARYTYAKLTDLRDVLARSFQGLPQTARVDRSGVLQQQVQLEYAQERLAAYGLDPGKLSSIIDARNITAGGGAFEAAAPNGPPLRAGLYLNAQTTG